MHSPSASRLSAKTVDLYRDYKKQFHSHAIVPSVKFHTSHDLSQKRERQNLPLLQKNPYTSYLQLFVPAPLTGRIAKTV